MRRLGRSCKNCVPQFFCPPVRSMEFRIRPLRSEKITRAVLGCPVDKGKMTNSPAGFADECLAKRGPGESIINLQSRTPALHFSRRRGLQSHAKIVGPTRPRQPSVKSSIENRVSLAQARFDMLQGEALQKILRGHTGPFRKKPMKVKLAEPNTVRQPR